MEYFYRIHGFFPPEEQRMGHYGFNIWLDKNIAKKAYATKLEENVRNHFITEAKEIIKRTFPKKMISKHETPYIFIEDSCLVQICQVPGNACDIGLDIMDIELIKTGDIDVNYTPHNVDMMMQQYALLSIFLNWTHGVKGLISR